LLNFFLTIWIGAVMSSLSHHAGMFKTILLYAGVFAAAHAVFRHELFHQKRLTLWDEVMAFWGLFALGDLLW